MIEKPDKRLISGGRVICQCSLILPKDNPFANYKAQRSGYIVLNVRGANLYLGIQFTPENVAQAFPPDEYALIKKLTLFDDEGHEVVVGDINVRFLKFTDGSKVTGMVLRFVNTSEEQLDLLNSLVDIFPLVEGPEEDAIPAEKLEQLL